MTVYDDIIAISDQNQGNNNNQHGPSIVSQPRTVPTRASSPNFLIAGANLESKPNNDKSNGKLTNNESQAAVFKDTYLNRTLIGESPSKFISSRLSTTKLIDSPVPVRLGTMESNYLSIESPIFGLENNPLNTSTVSNCSGNNLSFNVSQNLTPTYSALKYSPSIPPLDDSKHKACSAWFLAAEQGDQDKVEQMLSLKQVELSARGIVL